MFFCSLKLRRKALQKPDLSLEKMLRLGRALETSERQANVIEDNSHANQTRKPLVSQIKKNTKP